MSSTSTSAPIVCGIDGSPGSDAALDWALEVAHRRHLPVHLVHARGVPFGDPGFPHLYTDATPEQSDVMEKARSRAAEVGPDVELTFEEPRTTAAKALLGAAESADTLVLGARGHNLASALLLGSTSVQMTAHASCPVVVVRGAPRPDADVVVGVDGSPDAEAAIRFALREAAERGVGLIALYASWAAVTDSASLSAHLGTTWQDLEAAERRRAFDAVDAAHKDYPEVSVREVVVAERPVQALVDASEGAGLVVVGGRGRGGFTGLLLGSVGRGVLHGSHCTVVVAHRR